MPNISGFTIIRNGVKFDYPFIESIKSLLPLVDDFVVSVGKSEDNTLEYIKKINSPKIKIIEAVWNNENRQKGSEFAHQTNIALKECRFPWAFYLQADEVVHENDISIIRKCVEKYNDIADIDALTFRYIHFEANYNYYNPLRYKRAVRLIRNTSDIISIKDAAEFGHRSGKRIRTADSGAHIYHYGWVKSPKIMLEKMKIFEKYWHKDDYIEKKFTGLEEFDFKLLEVSKLFKGSHPSVMTERIKSWNFPLPRKVPRRPLIFRKMTWHILLRKWGIIKDNWL